MSPQPRRKTSADAAVAEATGSPVAADFHGLELSLPSKLPTSLVLRLGRLQRATEEDSMGAMYDVIARMVGDDQIEAVMDRMDDVGGDFNDRFRELLNAVTGAYGAEPGE